jgi:hypothetical protein
MRGHSCLPVLRRTRPASFLGRDAGRAEPDASTLALVYPSYRDLRHKKRDSSRVPPPFQFPACHSREPTRFRRDIVIQEKVRRAATRWPTRARVRWLRQPATRRWAIDRRGVATRASVARDFVTQIRDSVTWDNCPSAVEPISFAALLDGDQRLARCWREPRCARTRPVRLSQARRVERP